MRNGRSIHVVFNMVLFFLAASFSQAHGERLYRWTDDTGRPCYSNVSPPAEAKARGVEVMYRFVSDRPDPERASVETGKSEKISNETDESDSDLSAVVLKQRIQDRRRSIDSIEALLQRQPNNSALRKSLLKKKQYLFEDLTRLENVRP